MLEKIKLYAYAALLILAIWFGWGFYSNYNAITKRTAETATNDVSRVVSVTPTNPVDATNAALVTNAVAPATNPIVQAANQEATASNQLAAVTDAATTVTNSPVTPTAAAMPPPVPAVAPRKGSQGSMIGYLAGFVGVMIGLGLLIASDFSQYMAGRTVDLLFDDDGEAARDPEYEKAEQVWANGKPLEAIQMMRDYLKENPREQYVALRIAEIYEKDLRNYLAAALEYEEVLKKNLEPERWGWSAIHLCNLYSKMGQQPKTVALLERIVAEYPQTAAAKKAREKLGLPEWVAPPAPSAAASAEAASSPEKSEPDPAKSNLPPGFRPKK